MTELIADQNAHLSMLSVYLCLRLSAWSSTPGHPPLSSFSLYWLFSLSSSFSKPKRQNKTKRERAGKAIMFLFLDEQRKLLRTWEIPVQPVQLSVHEVVVFFYLFAFFYLNVNHSKQCGNSAAAFRDRRRKIRRLHTFWPRDERWLVTGIILHIFPVFVFCFCLFFFFWSFYLLRNYR